MISKDRRENPTKVPTGRSLNQSITSTEENLWTTKNTWNDIGWLLQLDWDQSITSSRWIWNDSTKSCNDLVPRSVKTCKNTLWMVVLSLKMSTHFLPVLEELVGSVSTYFCKMCFLLQSASLPFCQNWFLGTSWHQRLTTSRLAAICAFISSSLFSAAVVFPPCEQSSSAFLTDKRRPTVQCFDFLKCPNCSSHSQSEVQQDPRVCESLSCFGIVQHQSWSSHVCEIGWLMTGKPGKSRP